MWEQSQQPALWRWLLPMDFHFLHIQRLDTMIKRKKTKKNESMRVVQDGKPSFSVIFRNKVEKLSF